LEEKRKTGNLRDRSFECVEKEERKIDELEERLRLGDGGGKTEKQDKWAEKDGKKDR
jgi:hypothetical protein